MSFSIAGKTAIITGAANGVGRSIARHFISEGANVMLADRDEEHLREEVANAFSRVTCAKN
jgi:7-alpha-hydroxysteroid dehydrogenase